MCLLNKSEVKVAKKEKPQMLKGFNFNPLQKTCKGIIDSIENGTDREDDADHVYEVVLETFYGRDIWKWINSRY